MDVKYQIFVSSTFIDLEDERRKVIEQILNLGHIPVGMELFQAGDESQWSYIKRRISECDYYLVVVAERYGSETSAGKSYTQLEYEYAVKNKIPSIAFLLQESARKNWPQAKIEFTKKDKVDKFRGLCEKKITKYWNNADDLGAKVIASLIELMRNKPRIGWVRASSAASPETLAEITKLSDEKRALQAKLIEMESASQALQMPPEVRHHMDMLKSHRLTFFIHAPDSEQKNEIDKIEISTLYAYRYLSRGFATGISSSNVSKSILNIIGGKDELRISVQWLLNELAARNLIRLEEKKRKIGTIESFETTYLLTDFGKVLLLHVEAIDPKNRMKNVTKT